MVDSVSWQAGGRVYYHGTEPAAARHGSRRPRARGRAGAVDAMQPRSFGTLLRRYRIAAGLTQEELAERAGIPRALVQGLQVLEGGCQRRGGHAPYAPILGALQRHLRGQRPAQLRTALRECAWLVRLLPELAAGPIPPLPAWTLPPEQERRLMFEAVARFLTNVAGPMGTLLVLDDLQWVGPDALDLLATLIRSAAEVPLRAIGAYRN